ncbi:unnamed protein product [Commensalibacter communis]|uniref:hypothetical protein n=1 Tax=Commensalibacter communis TaxID=2972786 RepID=UPI0022FFAE6A|nr:hypothetical protein [Commensalibacter communis]CAI3952874.1 unnamed protein product [Commensalibacter communis]
MVSRTLKIKDPVLWQKLYNRNYDMLYFLIEKPLRDFMSVKYKTAKRGVQEMGCDQQLELYKDALNNM